VKVSVLKLRHAIVTAILLMISLSPFVRAEREGEQIAEGLEGRFMFRMWETAEGILPTSVKAITQTRNGYVWLAAQDSIVRFDGARAKSFSGTSVPLMASPLRSLATFADAGGRLWCSSTDKSLYVMESDVWRKFGADDGWEAADTVRSFTQHGGGELVAVAGMRLLAFRNGKLVPLPLPAGAAALPTLQARHARDGKLWMATRTSLWIRVDEEWIAADRNLPVDTSAESLTPGGPDGVWISTGKELRLYSRAGLLKTVPLPVGMRVEPLQMLEDSGGNVWFGSQSNGLHVRTADGRMLESAGNREMLRPQVTCIFEDRERNVIVGTAGAGIARFKPANFTVLLGESGSLSGTMVNSIAVTGPGRVLLGTEGNGLVGVENGVASRRIVTADGALDARARVTSVLALRDGRAIAAVASHGLFLVSDGQTTAIPSPPDVAKLVRSLYETMDGSVWIGCETGVFTWKDGVIAPLPASGAATLRNVRGIAQRADGTIVAIHDAGVYLVRGGQAIPAPFQIPAGTPLALASEAAGPLWIAVEKVGLVRVDGAQVFVFNADSRLPRGSIGAIVPTARDLWLSTENGLLRIPRHSLEAVATGKKPHLQSQIFNRGDGLPSDLFRRGYQPTAAREPDGTLWFASHKGAVGTKPDRISMPAYDVPAIIEEFRAERLAIPVTAANRDNVVIPKGTRNITVRCTVPSLSKPEFVRIDFSLEGTRAQWQQADNERVFRFFDLPPGKHRFNVRAIGSDGAVLDPQTSVGFTILPEYWETTWFRALMVLCALCVAGFVFGRISKFRLGLREARLREQESRTTLEKQLQQATQVEAIGRLAGGIAHDFNNILTSILGNAELAHMEFGRDPRLAPLLNDIMTAGSRARDLVVQILTYSRRRPAALAPLNVGPAIKDSLALLRSGIPATVSIDVQVPDELPFVLADASQIQRVIVNLCTNSAQALGPGGGSIRIKAERLRADAAFCAANPKIPRGRYVRISVSDTGSGMDDHTLKHIFDPFFTTKGVGKGTGLGLAVVQGIVDSHNGLITVESRLREGTTFSIYLPVTDPPSGSSEPVTRSIVIMGNNEHVLLVDDEPAVLNIARRYLEMLGYTVDEFNSPNAAVDAITANPDAFDLVFTDFAMPGMNGVELAQRIRAVRADIPIILCTGFGGAVDEDAARKVGIAQIVNKPYQKATIAQALSNALQSRAN
jgi:signal transduction histidine kinase/ligand-binding sensor domain-containing protein/ActR/RegA family two-component response regulator